MKAVVLIEGFAGGSRLSARFRQDLQIAGFKIVKNQHEADIIVAHSTGCYDLPLDTRAELFVLIGPPFWPGQPILRRAFHKIRSDNAYVRKTYGRRYYIVKKFWESYYIFAKPKYLWLVLANKSKLEFLQKVEDKKIILIRNKNDKFCSPEIKETVATNKNVRFVELPGGHDDYYTNPEPYIELIQSEHDRG